MERPGPIKGEAPRAEKELVEPVRSDAEARSGDPDAIEAVSATFVQLAVAVSAVLSVVLLGVVVAGADRDWLVFAALLAGHAGLGVWQLRRDRPDPLVHAAALAVAVSWLLFFSAVASLVIPLGGAAALGLASAFGFGRRLLAYLAFAGGIWLMELTMLTREMLTDDLPAGQHADAAVGLVLQLGLFVVIRTVVRRITGSVRANKILYGNLFENAPISLWREDFSRVAVWADGLKEAGVTDLRAHLKANPEVLEDAIGLIEIVDMNAAALALIGASYKSEIVGRLAPSTIGPETLPSFVNQLMAVWDGHDQISSEVHGRRLDGGRFSAVLNWSATSRSGRRDLSNVMVSIDDITLLKSTQAELARSRDLMSGVVDAQAAFINGSGIEEIYGSLLESSLAHTGSQRAHIAELSSGPEEPLRIRLHSRVARRPGDTSASSSLRPDVGAMAQLFEKVIRTRDSHLILGHEDAEDLKADFDTFLGIPIRIGTQTLGVLALADRVEGFTVELAEELAPLVTTSANLIQAHHTERNRRAVESELRAAEARLRAVMGGVPVSVFMVDRAGMLTLASGAGLQAIGIDPDGSVGRSAFDLFDRSPAMMDQLRRALGGEEVSELVRIGDLTFATTLRPFGKRGDRSESVIGVATDLTDRHRIESALAESQQRFRVLVERVSDLIYTLDEEGTIRFITPSVTTLLGYQPDELIGTSSLALLHRQDVPEVVEAAAAIAPGKTGPPTEHRVRHADGSWRYMEATATNLLEDPIIQGWLVNGRDVTNRKRAEEILRQSEASFRLLAENSTDLISRHRPDGTYLYASPACLPLLGYTPDEMVGRAINEFFHPDDLATAEAAYQAMLGAPGVQTMSYRARRADGTYLWLESTSRTIVDPKTGELVEIQAASRDITERKAFEAALEEARDDAQAATIVKSQFLANMSHEIRTPMNAIVGMTELSLATDLTAEQREYLGTIKSAVDSLLTLINDILDVSKIEAGHLEFERIAFSLTDVVEDTVRTLAVKAAEKGLDLSYDIGDDVPEGVMGDPGRLRQILFNLVGNAIKFTNVGTVSVGVSTVPGDSSLVLFEVTDTGIGIAPDKLDRIFEAFSQADGSMTRRYGGTGLGLSISRDIATALGGTMTASSESGAGSTFSFTLALDTLDEDVLVEPAAGGSVEHHAVLVVSDTSASKRSLAEILRQGNLVPLPAADMSEAHAVLEQAAAAGHHPSLIVVDQQSEVIPFTERLIEHQAFSGLPVVVVSGLGQRGDASRLRELGVSGYLTKPFEAGDLLEAIRVVASGAVSGTGELVTKHWIRERRRHVHVLLADDSPTNRRLAMRLLEKRGHAVTAVENGLEAVQAVEKDSYDVILMDVQMPEMDGLEATTAIREAEQISGSRIPIVALTAHAMKGDRDRCLAAGMDAYLSKPFQAEELFATIEQLVSYAAAESSPPVATGEEPATAGAEPRLAGDSLIDMSGALGRVGGDPEVLAEVTEIFLEGYAEQFDELAGAIASQDMAAAAKVAHRLKGELGTLGATQAFEAGQEIVTLARADDVAGVAGAFEWFRQEMERVEPHLIAVSQGHLPEE